jgi:hypothetical protein
MMSGESDTRMYRFVATSPGIAGLLFGCAPLYPSCRVLSCRIVVGSIRQALALLSSRNARVGRDHELLHEP